MPSPIAHAAMGYLISSPLFSGRGPLRRLRVRYDRSPEVGRFWEFGICQAGREWRVGIGAHELWVGAQQQLELHRSRSDRKRMRAFLWLIILFSAQVNADQFGVYGGIGVKTSNGSGAVMAEILPLPSFKVFLHVWTDDEGSEHEIIIRDNPPPFDIPFTVETGNTSNVALGAAWCGYYKYLRGCIGGAYLTDGDNRNITDHTQAYLEIGGKITDRWRIFYAHYSDFDDSDDENFVMIGYSWNANPQRSN